MPEYPYLQWPVFRRSVVAAFERSLTFNASTATPTDLFLELAILFNPTGEAFLAPDDPDSR